METLWQALEKAQFKVSTDTREDLKGKVFFALKGDKFDGNEFVPKALEQGAVAAVTENEAWAGITGAIVVKDVLKTLQEAATRYRDTISVPVIAIGGSNGKTTTKELAKLVLEKKYKVYATAGNLNNHIGVPLSIFNLDRVAEVAVLEVGANHPGEHTELLEILKPTHVLVTNSGLDHLEGFGSVEGVIKANGEINTWAESHGGVAINKLDLALKVTTSLPLSIELNGKTYETKMVGDYNLENIVWAVSIGNAFGVDEEKAMSAIASYIPSSKRSQLVIQGSNKFVVDCYNANPSSMELSLKSFLNSSPAPRGLILGDMLELGEYAEAEHKKVIELLKPYSLETIILVGPEFQKASKDSDLKYEWFLSSEEARNFFINNNYENYTFLLKGSRGMRVERVIGL